MKTTECMRESTPIPDADERRKKAEEIGRKLYGEKKWNAIKNTLSELDPNFAKMVEEIPYGSVYPRESLSLEMREVIAIASLTQLNLRPQLKSHIIAALNIGMTRNTIVEMFIHLAMFIGFPTAMEGLKVAREVFDHYDKKEKSGEN